MSLDFGEVLTRAWQILWKYKVLWLFGFLASCGTGGGGNMNFRFSQDMGGRPLHPELRLFFAYMHRVSEWLMNNRWIFIVGGLVFLGLLFFFIALNTLGRIGLIRGVFAAEQGAEHLSAGELFSASFPYFWRVFWLNLIPGLLALLIVLPLAVFGAITAGVGFLCLLPFICLLVPLLIVLGLVIEQANRAIVLEERSLLAGLQRGWEVFKSNLGSILIMALILFVLTLALTFIIALPIVAIVFPFVLAILHGASVLRFWWVVLALLCLYAPIAWFLQSLLMTYIQSAWTLTYLRLTRSSEMISVATTNA